MMKKLLYFVLIIATAVSCTKPTSTEVPVAETVLDSPASPAQDDSTAEANSSLTLAIIDGANGTFGYDILKDGKVHIHQPHLPGVAGNLGFVKREQAEKAAKLMIEKIRNNIVPPTISEEELRAILIE